MSDDRSTDEGFGGYEEDTDLARDLSLFDITMIGVGAMIGAGIFVLSGLAAGQAGPALAMAFAFNGFITIFTAMVYAELGSAILEAGGGYLWVREALGRSQAFIAGWMSWFAHAVAGSLYTLGFGSFVTILLVEYFNIAPPFGLTESALEKVFAAFAGIPFTYITFRGAKETGLAGNHRNRHQGHHHLRVRHHRVRCYIRSTRHNGRATDAVSPAGGQRRVHRDGANVHCVRGL